MSRCFPFPPPGYEKKARPDDDANLSIKEKHKEKKHKVDKKDKEKKEKRDKKDKESSGGKSREKKDRKRKHKEKDKEEDRKKEKEEKDKNKEKEEKDLEKKKVVDSSSYQISKTFVVPIRIQVDPTQHGRPFGLEKGVGNQNGASEIRSVDKGSAKETDLKSSGEKLASSIGIMVEGDQKFEENRVPNGQSLKFIAKHLEIGFLGNILQKEQKVVGGAVSKEEFPEKQEEQKDKGKHKSSRGDKHKDRDRERKSKSKDKKRKKEKTKEEKVKDVSTPLQSKLIENGINTVDIQNDKGSYLSKSSNSNNGNLGKRKEPEMNGFVQANGGPINKIPRPLSSSKHEQNGSRNEASNPGIRFTSEKEAAVGQHKLDAKASSSSSSFENGNKLDNRQTPNNYAPERQEAINNHQDKASECPSSLQTSLGNGRKLEHCQTAVNFASKEQGSITKHKLNQKVLSSQLVAENGWKLESSLPSSSSSAKTERAVSKPKLDNRESRISGLALKKPDTGSKRPCSVADLVKETVEKPPHPDAKYLSRILSVPQVQWSDNDDQVWLFPKEGQGGKRPKIDSATPKESKLVWSEALQLESADVTALPYVIPY